MNVAGSPVVKDVVLVGAGHAHVIVLKAFGMRPMPGVRLTLLTRQVHTPYSGMLPGWIAGHYDFDQVHIDTGPLSRFAGARLYQAEAIGLDLKARTVLCRDRPPVPFDVLSLDIGSTPGGKDIPGVEAAAIPVKPIDRFEARFSEAHQRILQAGGPVRVGVVGGGAAGVELALALDTRLRRDIAAAGGQADNLDMVLLSSSPHVLPSLSRGARQRLERVLAERGVKVRANARVTGIAGGEVLVEGGPPERLDEVFWTTQARPAEWLAQTGLALDERGFIAVDDTLQSISHRGVFAAGDVASMRGYALPKSGVYAVRQGPYLDENIRRSLHASALKRYRPQGEALYLISTGERYAVGLRNGISFEGQWVWRWKDRIDRSFMERFNTLPDMAASKPEEQAGLADPEGKAPPDAMRCGGCGAKLGGEVLRGVLADIEPYPSDAVLVGLDAADDAAVIDQGNGMYAVQTVDHFRAMVDDPYTFGRIAANHALGDVFAMGAQPRTALAIATLAYGPRAKMGTELADLLAGANSVLREASCTLVGGHTGEGPETALGFAVTGAVTREGLLRKSGLTPGDALILTKPVGTGTILAAHMRGKAKARWVMGALVEMSRSSRQAADIVRTFQASAATDVTGFGLLGHLAEMLRASGVDAVLDIWRVPLLDGAGELLRAGFVSTLHDENARMAAILANSDEVADLAECAALHDPQTAGGLLVGVGGGRAYDCVAALQAAGYGRAAIVGHVVERLAGEAGHSPAVRIAHLPARSTRNERGPAPGRDGSIGATFA